MTVAFAAQSQSVTLTPSKDNSIYSENSNSAGAGKMYSGRTCTGNIRRAMIQFDLTSIPAGATIVSASLTVNSDLSGTTSNTVYTLHALTTAFGEGTSLPSGAGGTGAPAVAPDATWANAMTPSTPWTVPGGDFVAGAVSTVLMTPTGDQTFPSNASLISLVQTWHTSPASNFGFVIIGEEASSCSARRFGSKEQGIAPQLVINYSLPCTGPTAICQDINVFLNASGSASIVGSNLNNGSIDNCLTGSLSYSIPPTTFTCANLSSGGSGGLIITGVFDGPLVGGTPKGIELYTGTAIPNLSIYGVGSANNGAGSSGQEFTFPAVSVPAGTFIYVASEVPGFQAFFGFPPTYTDGSMNINGDDAIELFQNGAVIDVFGQINVDGTGTPWEYLDGWAYRNNFSSPNGGVFTATNWTYSGINALDFATTNATAITPFPIGAFQPPASGIPVTLTVTDGLGNTDVCTSIVTVLDTISAVPNTATLPDATGACEVTTINTPTATDNCGGLILGTTTTTFPILATTVVTWTFTDGSGNTTTQTQNVIIADNVAPVADLATLPNLTSDCPITPTAPTATDNCQGAISGTTTTPLPVAASTTIVWSYDDGNGNISTQNQTVTINGIDLSTTLVSTTITANASGMTYQWINCSTNTSLPGETNQSFTPSLTGDYAVIINNGSCSDTSACVNVLITTCPGPTAICQNINLYLDGTGSATITGASIDGGSTDDCVTGSLTPSASQTTFTCADLVVAPSGMIITGTYDGPLVGGNPKGVELFVTGAIADLSLYGIGSANNGGGTDGIEFTFPPVSVAAGTFLYVSADSAGFHNFFGFAPNFVSGAMAINGDDAVELFYDSVVVDVFGDINVDGTGTAWDHLDGWAYRNDFDPANNGIWNATTFYYSGIDALDFEVTNATAATPFPIGTYTTTGSAIPVTLTVTDGLSNTDQCTALVTLLDTLAPMADVAILADETAGCEVTTLTAPTATDNCSGPITGTTTTTFPITTTTVVVWTYTDDSGNTSTQNQTVTITDVSAPVPDIASLPALSNACELTPTPPTATDACEGVITGTTTTAFPITSSTAIQWTFDDGNGNTSTQFQSFTITGLDVSVVQGTQTLSANASGVSYQWIDCASNTDIAGETNQSFAPSTTGNFAVVISNGTCSDTSDCINMQIDGIEDLIDLGMSISPNPSTGKFNVTFDQFVSGTIYVYDGHGRLVESMEIKETNLTIDLTTYQSGMYIMKVATENGVSRERIVKY